MEDLMVFQNPWWADPDAIYDDERVEKALFQKPRISYRFEPVNKILIGPRQVGKTTYMKLSVAGLIESGINPRNVLYFSCDLLRDYREIVSIVRSFLRSVKGKAYLELFEELFIGRNYFQVKLHDLTPLFRKEWKFYFLNSLLIQTFKRLFGRGPETDRIIEGVVGEHLKRLYPTYFFSGSKEVDFLTPGFGVEVKWRKKVRPSDFPRVGIRNKVLLSKDTLEFIEGNNLAVIPVSLFLFQLHSPNSNLATVS
ncbi:AAA family ATPase [Thermococcus sp.]